MISMTYVSLSKLKQVVVSSSFLVIFMIVILTFRIWVIVRVNIITLKTLETSNAKKETESHISAINGSKNMICCRKYLWISVFT